MSANKEAPMSSTKNATKFVATNEEVDQMIDELLKVQRWDQNEIHNLSKAWIRVVMSQPYKKEKNQRRPFNYSKNKLMDYLDWRKKSCITAKISHHLKSDGSEIANLTAAKKQALYWYGADSEGSPILWYHSSHTNFDDAIVKNEMEYSALVIQAGLDAMPSDVYNINFVILFDVFNPLQAMKRPTLAPAFIKLFTTICPDRLKRGIFITGGLGHVFYKVAKRFAPASFMDKVAETRSREDAAQMLIDEKVVEEHNMPTFLGGTNNHHDDNNEIISKFSTMIEEVSIAMANAHGELINIDRKIMSAGDNDEEEEEEVEVEEYVRRIHV